MAQSHFGSKILKRIQTAILFLTLPLCSYKAFHTLQSIHCFYILADHSIITSWHCMGKFTYEFPKTNVPSPQACPKSLCPLPIGLPQTFICINEVNFLLQSFFEGFNGFLQRTWRKYFICRTASCILLKSLKNLNKYYTWSRIDFLLYRGH